MPQPPAYFQILVLIMLLLLLLVVLKQIYYFIVNPVLDVKTTPSTSSQTIWDLRFGHPDANVLRLMLNHCKYTHS